MRIDESLIQKLKKLEFRAKRVVEGFLLGLHPSPYHGYSSEFKEHREYYPFDDIKYVDWKLTARRERVFVKKFQEETNTKVYILLDASKSMNYGKPVKKIDIASEICAVFSYLSFLQRDAPGLYIFSEEIEKILPPRATRKHLSLMFRTLLELRPYGKTEPIRIFRGLSERIKRKGVVIIISDFLKNPGEFIKSIRYFKAKKHLVLVFRVLSREEMELRWRGPVTLKDMEYSQEYRLSERKDLNYLREQFLKSIDFLENELLKSRIFYTRVLTDQNIEKVFLNFLYKYRRYDF